MLRAHKPIPCELEWLWTSIDFICRRFDSAAFSSVFREWKKGGEFTISSLSSEAFNAPDFWLPSPRTHCWCKFSLFQIQFGTCSFAHWALLSNSRCFAGVTKKMPSVIVFLLQQAAVCMHSQIIWIVHCKLQLASNDSCLLPANYHGNWFYLQF